MQSAKRWLLAVVVVLAGSATLAPVASATITPSAALTPSSVTAGSTAPLGVDLKFAPGADSPKDITLSLPAGLLANASIDNGACLKTTMLSGTTCQVGTGTVSATLVVLNVPTTAISIPVTLYLVPPPASGDLAGVAIVASGSELGTPGSISVQPSGALQIAFTSVPDTFTGLPIAIDEISTSFSAMRMPTSCPATPAALSVTADSYADPTMRTASAPLTVTGCSALPYAPSLTVTAARDSGDDGIALHSDIKQAPGEATSRTVVLTLPTNAMSPNPGAFKELCSSPTFTGCSPVGSSTATSPLYPTALTGNAYLVGSLTALKVAIVFPPPFGLTLSGAVDTGKGSTTFTGVPDIPLTDLGVTLSGGPNALFLAACSSPSGTASASLTSQNGDKTASPTSPLTVTGCPAGSGGTGGGGGGGGQGGHSPGASKPRLGSTSLTGLRNGKPTLKFTLSAGHGAPKLNRFTIKLPRGLTFARHRVHGRLVVTGVSLANGKAKSVVLQQGHLVVTLRHAVASVRVKLGTRVLRESAALRSAIRRGSTKSLKLTVIARDLKGTRTSLTITFKHLNR